MTPETAFWLLFEDLPRHAPGSDRETLNWARCVAPLRPGARIIDLGCGIGRASLCLARHFPEATVLAIDLHAPFIEKVTAEAKRQGLTNLEARVGDFSKVDPSWETFDLLWCEGAAYHLGFGGALATWRPLLTPSGQAVVTEATWLNKAAPANLLEFWGREYPGMESLGPNTVAAQDAGFQVVDSFGLSRSAWWDEYYRPLRARCDALEPQAAEEPALRDAIAMARREIEACIEGYYYVGYVAYWLKRPG